MTPPQGPEQPGHDRRSAPADAAATPHIDNEGMRRLDPVLGGRHVSCGDRFAPREIGVRHGSIVAVEPLTAGLVGRAFVELAEDEHLFKYFLLHSGVDEVPARGRQDGG